MVIYVWKRNRYMMSLFFSLLGWWVIILKCFSTQWQQLSLNISVLVCTYIHVRTYESLDIWLICFYENCHVLGIFEDICKRIHIGEVTFLKSLLYIHFSVICFFQTSKPREFQINILIRSHTELNVNKTSRNILPHHPKVHCLCNYWSS